MMSAATLDMAIESALGDAKRLLVVPPFAAIELPSIALHLLQACAARDGFEVSVFYANLAFAAAIGEDFYEALSDGAGLPGERLFAHAAYGKSLQDLFPEHAAPYLSGQPVRTAPAVPVSVMREFGRQAADFSRLIGERIAARGYEVVGCSTTFEQTAASIALLNRIKELAPDVATLVGGANCEGAMAQGMAVLAPCADYIFSGESERTFPEFLATLARGQTPGQRIIQAKEAADLKDFPLPEFREYFAQLQIFLPDGLGANLQETWLPYESSRGCWWGEKSQCTFCGLNGLTVKQRSKTSDKVLEELSSLTKKYETQNVFAVDNIMPRPFFKTLLPRLKDVPDLNLFYEQKSNLSLEDLKALKSAGVNLIQPGIESLSTPLLKLMKKGVAGRHHIRLLRNARAVGISLNWNLLYDFPGDRPEYYEDMLRLIPHLVHYSPPLRLLRLSLDRFSPYFEEPAAHGITGMRPKAAYAEILPGDAPIEQIAYHFEGHFDSAARRNPQLFADLEIEIERWKGLWSSGKVAPMLSVAAINEETSLLVDTRYPTPARYEFIDRRTRDLLLAERRVADADDDLYPWALEQNFMCEMDGIYIPLAIAADAAPEALPPRADVESESLAMSSG